jgi:hypothetical protein
VLADFDLLTGSFGNRNHEVVLAIFWLEAKGSRDQGERSVLFGCRHGGSLLLLDLI